MLTTPTPPPTLDSCLLALCLGEAEPLLSESFSPEALAQRLAATGPIDDVAPRTIEMVATGDIEALGQ
jgi:hypothetical protein